jgi:hypothetical protein
MNAEETSIPGEILSEAASGSTVSPPCRADLFHLGLVLVSLLPRPKIQCKLPCGTRSHTLIWFAGLRGAIF